MNRPCTLTRWRVEPDQRAAFEEVLIELEAVLLRLPHPPASLILLQSSEDPTTLHTIGWFETQADLEAMRQHEDARRLLDELVRLSSDFRPTAHRVVRTAGGAA